MKEILLQYTRYNVWANKRIGEQLQQIGHEEADREFGGSFPSIRATLYHIWNAESIWIQRLHMSETLLIPAAEFTGSIAEACTAMAEVSQQFVSFTEKQFDDRGLQHEFTYHTLKKERMKNQVWEAIQHCMNHSSFHRGQIINYCRMLGHTRIINTDLITFTREKK